MKSITRHTIIISTCIAFCQFAQAQDPTPSATPNSSPAASPAPKDKQGKHHPGDMMGRLSKRLGLSDEQKTKLQAIFDAHRAQMKAIDDQALTPDAKREKMKPIMTDIKAQASSFLTPDQMQKWDAMSTKEQWQERRHPAKGAQDTQSTQ